MTTLLSKIRTSKRMKCYFLYLAQNTIKTQFKSSTVGVDAIDSFTTQLVQQKSDKLYNTKLRNPLLVLKSSTVLNDHPADIDINLVTEVTLPSLLQSSLDEANIGKILLLIGKCKQLNFCPEDSMMISCLAYIAQNACLEGIEDLRAICRQLNPLLLQVHSNFDHYTAEALWLKGNVPKALLLFNKVYKENIHLRRKTRWLLRYLLFEATNNYGEAVTVMLLNFTECFAREHNDYFPMMYFWQVCFLSNWFSDQQIAADMIETHQELLKMIIIDIQFIISAALKNHKTEPVYKLLEILLKYRCKEQYSTVLMALYDYKFQQGDFYGCHQILQWSTKNNIMIPAVQQEKLLNLLLKVKETESNYEVSTRKSTKPNVQFKF